VVPGTTLQRLRGWVPVLDSFGLETDIRLKSRGTGKYLSTQSIPNLEKKLFAKCTLMVGVSLVVIH
jgi:hypothetical protein